jgi:DNA-binding HxlR family transcriptional regulator
VILDRIGNKWTVLVVLLLSDGVTEWAEAHVPAISQAQQHYDLTAG